MTFQGFIYACLLLFISNPFTYVGALLIFIILIVSKKKEAAEIFFWSFLILMLFLFWLLKFPQL